MNSRLGKLPLVPENGLSSVTNFSWHPALLPIPTPPSPAPPRPQPVPGLSVLHPPTPEPHRGGQEPWTKPGLQRGPGAGHPQRAPGRHSPGKGSGLSSRGTSREPRPVPIPHLLPRLVQPPQPLLQLPPVAPRRLDALPSLLQEEPHLGLGGGGLHGQPRRQQAVLGRGGRTSVPEGPRIRGAGRDGAGSAAGAGAGGGPGARSGGCDVSCS